MPEHMLRRVCRMSLRRARAFLENGDSSRRSRMPRYRRDGHRMLDRELALGRLERGCGSELTFSQKLLWCDVWFAATQTRRHVHGRLPRETVHRRSTIVTDLNIET